MEAVARCTVSLDLSTSRLIDSNRLSYPILVILITAIIIPIHTLYARRMRGIAKLSWSAEPRLEGLCDLIYQVNKTEPQWPTDVQSKKIWVQVVFWKILARHNNTFESLPVYQFTTTTNLVPKDAAWCMSRMTRTLKLKILEHIGKVKWVSVGRSSNF